MDQEEITLKTSPVKQQQAKDFEQHTSTKMLEQNEVREKQMQDGKRKLFKLDLKDVFWQTM